MKLKIGYLYYDLLNLYGENGNIKALKNLLESMDIKTEIHFITIGDKINFDKFDFVYIGAGTEENLEIALKDLLKYKDELKKYIDNNKFFLATGNSIDLFGKYITEKDNKKIKCLNLFNYRVKREDFRMIDEAIFKCDFIDKPLIGFQNQYSVMQENKNPMFKVIKGIGSFPKSPKEGVHYKNFYGSYLVGPILVRNPHFLEYLVKEIVLSKDPNYKFKRFNLKEEYSAYNSFINNFYEEKLKKQTN